MSELKKVKVGGSLPQSIRPFQIYNITNWLLLAVLLISNAVLIVMILRMKPTIQVVAIEDGETRFINNDYDEILSEEEYRFSKRFIKRFFNRTPEKLYQFNESVLELNEETFQGKDTEIQEIKKQVASGELVQNVSIKSIDVTDEVYTFDLVIDRTFRGQQETLFRTIKITLTRIKRTREKPWGLEVSRLSEGARVSRGGDS